MAGSIGDWYGNTAGRLGERAGHDPDNDDRADRTPDTWLDVLHAPRTPETRRTPRAVAPTRRREPTPARGSYRKITDAATAGELARAAHVLLARKPGVDVDAMTMMLRRQLGWPSLGAGQVREALGYEQKHKDTLVAKMAQDARVIMARFPGIGPKKLAARLRERGWRDATPDKVAAALKPQPTALARPRTKPPSNARKQKRQREPVGVQDMTPAQLRARRARDQAMVAVTAQRSARLVADVHAFHAREPQAGPIEITEHLRRRGWPLITLDEVRQALRRRPASISSAPAGPFSRPSPEPQRTLDLPVRPNTPTCAGCGRVISRLGICGCF